MFNFKYFAAAGIIAILVLYAPQAIASDPPSYMPVDSGYDNFHTGYVEVYNAAQGLNYGKAKVEWNYWCSSSNDYWYYAYKLCNNEGGNVNDRTDDYHFGTVYNSGTAAGINTLDIDLPYAAQMITGNEMFVVSTSAGSSSGGNAWDPLIKELVDNGNSFVTGLNWSASRANGNTILPTQWTWTKVGQSWKWLQIYAGDTSSIDPGGQYFEIASKNAPTLVTAHVSNGTVSSDTTASGSIYGPVPEPATVALLGLGFLAVSSYRRRIIR